ncbi:excinuclease ABC subunit UvrA [Patescibacteria group bacterium]|nr:excinuclease ABC subunit UvrA [Patescibacteria group bacterium]
MKNNYIKIRGAKVHNLKNIDLDIPKNKLVVITGISGSGKSSLAFDTLYAEGQRRYVESLSVYARQFLGVMDKPDVERIEGISPAISIDQRKAASNPRSTVGTITEIYDYLRLLFARIGKPHCPKCKKPVSCQTIDQILDQITGQGFVGKEITILGPVIGSRKGEHLGVLEEIQREGFVRVRIDGILYRIEEALQKMLDRKKKHTIEVVVDRLKIEKDLDRSRLADSVETAMKLGKGTTIVSTKHEVQSAKKQRRNLQAFSDLIFSEHFACEKCGISLPEIEPRLFSFNSPYGACLSCQGLGEKLEVDPKLVIPNLNLTIEEGAIRPWMRASHRLGRQSYFWLQLAGLAEKCNFSLNTPVKELPKKIIDLILYGESAKSEIRSTPAPEQSSVLGGTAKQEIPNSSFEGVIPSLERRYRETDSDYTREEIEQYMFKKKCETCMGKRLNHAALAVTVAGKSIDEVVVVSIDKAKRFFEGLYEARSTKYKETKKRSSGAALKGVSFGSSRLHASDLKIALPIVKEIVNRLQFLIDVGLNYLTCNRKTGTLAGGEEQRIRLATQIGSKLSGVLYILDEPSVGLHSRDQQRLIKILKKLRDLGNTICVVEHDPQTILAADWIIDIGPGAGKHGGRVIFQGTPKELLKAKTLTGEYMSGRKKVEVRSAKTSVSSAEPYEETKRSSDSKTSNFLLIKGAQEHNLKNINVRIPLGKFICITGVSGSGKSSLMNDILARALLKKFYNTKEEPGKHKNILGWENLNKMVLVNQSPIGRTPRSNPVTYTGAFFHIRDLFSKTKEARIRGYLPGRFSFNIKGGRCEVCEGQGVKKIEMYFLPDVYVECQECKGKRFNKETLSIGYKGKNISEVLEMTVEEALEFFKVIPSISQKLKTLNEVGLSYIHLGQPAPSLSGGEAQRVKLSTELSRKATGKTLYILDEPTTGLHPDDIKKLVWILRGLVDMGNTVLIIEHNLDVIKNADWIIDLGPEGGEGGGKIVVEGLPQDVIKNKKSYTGKYLKPVFMGKRVAF